ncbi:MAG: VOC family protein [Acidimicrobiia bacterium]|nr:VOC family protein [Acidimicrobiia bacterium]
MSRHTNARVQLALNVSDLDEAVDFYRRLFGTEPAKRHDGYANFAIDSPPLKLVLFENAEAPGSLNHLGIEVPTSAEVTTTAQRLDAQGLDAGDPGRETCCYATQDKVWVTGPDETRWEIYTVLADSPTRAVGDGGCCSAPVAGAEVSAAR